MARKNDQICNKNQLSKYVRNPTANLVIYIEQKIKKQEKYTDLQIKLNVL